MVRLTNMASPLNDLTKSLRRQGVEIKNGSSHLKLVYQGKLVGVLPKNLQGENAYKRTCAQLRRVGLAA